MERAGVILPPGVTGVHDIDTSRWCRSRSHWPLRRGISKTFTCPDSCLNLPPIRFRVCTQLVELMQQLGYRDDLSFHQFLYPNETDVHKILRFLVDKLSKSSPASSKGKSRRRLGLMASGNVQRTSSSEGTSSSSGTTMKDEPSVDIEEIQRLEQRLAELKEQISELDTGESDHEEIEQKLKEEIESTKCLENKLSILQEAVSLIRSDESPRSAINRLRSSSDENAEVLQASKQYWEAIKEGLEEQLSSRPDFNEDEKLQVESLKAKLRMRKEEQEILEAELEKLPKQASRSSYVRRITELVKNSKKQDGDVAKIISETRVIQRENNTIQERLHRIHALVDELVFREAKKDASCRLAYRLLSKMHESFSDLVDKVFEMDKLDREISELQLEIEAIDKEPVDIVKVQSDLDTIRKENVLRHNHN